MITQEKTEPSVLLWSVAQKCFHCEPLSETFRYGAQAYSKNDEGQSYLVLYIADTRSEIEEFQKTLIEKHGDKRP